MSHRPETVQAADPVLLLTPEDFDRVLPLFISQFHSDPYYRKLFPEEQTRDEQMAEAFSPWIRYALGQGYCYGIEREGELACIRLGVDYEREMNDDMFDSLLEGASQTLVERLEELLEDGRQIIYLVASATEERFKRQGLASRLLDFIMDKYPEAVFVTDISSPIALKMYEKRGFSVEELEEGYYFCVSPSR